jgi:hypothetical protein
VQYSRRNNSCIDFKEVAAFSLVVVAALVIVLVVGVVVVVVVVGVVVVVVVVGVVGVVGVVVVRLETTMTMSDVGPSFLFMITVGTIAAKITAIIITTTMIITAAERHG